MRNKGARTKPSRRNHHPNMWRWTEGFLLQWRSKSQISSRSAGTWQSSVTTVVDPTGTSTLQRLSSTQFQPQVPRQRWILKWLGLTSGWFAVKKRTKRAILRDFFVGFLSSTNKHVLTHTRSICCKGSPAEAELNRPTSAQPTSPGLTMRWCRQVAWPHRSEASLTNGDFVF